MKKITSALCLLLAAILLVILPLPSLAADSAWFSDVPAGVWYADSVRFCLDNGLMNGTGGSRFSPGETASRAMLVSVLYRQAGSPPAEPSEKFRDVPKDAYYAGAVAWGSSTGIVTGCGNGIFGSENPVTREDLAAFLWRASGEPEAHSAQDFADSSKISSYARTAVSWARENGIINGKDGNRFDPKGRATRAEMAAMLTRWVCGKIERPSEMPSDEYERAIWYGFADRWMDKGRTITWSEYCAMIGSMLSHIDSSLGSEWQDLAARALKSKKEMLREQGCFALYCAIDLMDEEYNDAGLRSVSTNPHLLSSNDGNLPYSWDYTEFTGPDQEWVLDGSYEGLFGRSYAMASIMYCQYRMSLCSFETLYDTQKHIIGPLTVEDAVLSVVRLYESTHDAARAFWLDRLDRLEEEVSAAGEPEAVTALRDEILGTKSGIVKSDTQIPGKTYTGTAYYVSESGSDSNDGLTPETAWATIQRVNRQAFRYGDAVFFERGGTYRGNLYLYDPEGYVTVSAYGQGEKPVLTSAEECAAGAEKWQLWREVDGKKIWKYYKDCLDCGMIVFDDEKAGVKITAKWSGKEWLNKDGTPFDVAAALTENLDFFSDDGGKCGGATSFYNIPVSTTAKDVQYGPLYLRCDEGNPGELYDCIELCTMTVTETKNGAYEGTVLAGVKGTVFDNLSVKYFPMGAMGFGPEDSAIQNCEIAWGGGCVQYMENGIVTGQMGDAINGCGHKNCLIEGNYIHDIASSPLIIESYTNVQIENVSFSGNLIDRTNCGINVNNNENLSFKNVAFDDNIFYRVGACDMGRQDIRTGRMFPGEWTACYRFLEVDTFTDCSISGNQMYYPLFFFYYCCPSMPEMSDNLYVPCKHTFGFADIRYDEQAGPYLPALMDGAERIIREVFCDSSSIMR